MFHHDILDASSNNIKCSTYNIVLLLHLFGCTRGLCQSSSKDVIHSKHCVPAIVHTVNRRDQSVGVSNVHAEINALCWMKRLYIESFKNFELCFNAQQSESNSLSCKIFYTFRMAALLLLITAMLESEQRVSILAKASLFSHLFKFRPRVLITCLITLTTIRSQRFYIIAMSVMKERTKSCTSPQALYQSLPFTKCNVTNIFRLNTSRLASAFIILNPNRCVRCGK